MVRAQDQPTARSGQVTDRHVRMVDDLLDAGEVTEAPIDPIGAVVRRVCVCSTSDEELERERTRDHMPVPAPGDQERWRIVRIDRDDSRIGGP